MEIEALDEAASKEVAPRSGDPLKDLIMLCRFIAKIQHTAETSQLQYRSPTVVKWEALLKAYNETLINDLLDNIRKQ